MRYEVGTRFGTVEIVGMAENKYNFLCDCGHPFSRAISAVDATSAPRRCVMCRTPMNGTQFVPLGVRPYTAEELKMIEDFEKANE